MSEVWKNAVRSLWRKRLRALLTVGGIVVGVALVTVVSVIGEAGKTAVNGELDSMGLNGLSVMATTDSVIEADEWEALRGLSGVESAVPLMIDTGQTRWHGVETELAVCGIDSGETQAIGLTTLHGRLLSDSDVAAYARVCVVDAAVAKMAYERENIVGKQLTFPVGGITETFTVVGVTEAGSSLLQNVAQWIPSMVYIPYTTMQQLSGRTYFDQLAVQLEPYASGEEMASRIEQTLGRVSGGSVYKAQDLSAQKDRLTKLMDIVTLVLTAISAISLLVSGLSIMTIMMVSVGERTREIGVKKAIGASNGRIRREFLAEAVLLSLCGGIGGVVIGGGAGFLGLTAFGVQAAVSPWTVVCLIGFAVVIGVLFGVYPAAKAAKLRPVDALRAE